MVNNLLFCAILCFGFVLLFMNNKQRTLSTDEGIQTPDLTSIANQDSTNIDNNSILDSSVFSDIYEEHVWGVGSGVGSQESNTVEYRELLQRIFDDERFNSFVDFGCGDFQIMA